MILLNLSGKRQGSCCKCLGSSILHFSWSSWSRLLCSRHLEDGFQDLQLWPQMGWLQHGQLLWTTARPLINSMSHKTGLATKQSMAFLPAVRPTSCNHLRREFISHSGIIVYPCWELNCWLGENWKTIVQHSWLFTW